MLKLSKKWNYALKTIIYLANSGNNSFLKIATISKDLNISESLLRRIISELEKSGIVKTTKGRMNSDLKKLFRNICFWCFTSCWWRTWNYRLYKMIILWESAELRYYNSL